MIDQLYKNIDI